MVVFECLDTDVVLGCKERILFEHLQREYTPRLVREVLLPLVRQSSPVSLRVLDWAVVNWSKQRNVVVSSARTPGAWTNVHQAYREMLHHWKRKLFDPFRRRTRIRVRCEPDEWEETTLGQANFALWAYQSGVLAYVLGHVEAIEQDMNAVSQRQKASRREAARCGHARKRTELTPPAASGGCIAYVRRARMVVDG